MTIFFEARHQAEEAGKEAQRIVVEKGLGFIASIIFLFRASSSAKKCADGYIDAVMAGGSNIFCTCGYHMSRRKMKTILTREVVMKDLEKIYKRFPTIGGGTEVDRTAKLFLQIFDVLRGRLNKPDAVKKIYADSEKAAEILPKSVCDIVRRLCAGEINMEQADNELVELKGHYQTLIGELGINPAEAEVFLIQL